MPCLRELQVAMLDALLDRPSDAHAHVRANGLDPRRRLAVYRHNLFDSLSAALAAVYPTVEQLVGAGFFAYAAHEYILAHPPRSGNLHDFGEAFPLFLDGFAPARELCYLGDSARLDWAWHGVFHSEPAPRADASVVLAGIAALPVHERASVTLGWQPAARLLASPYPVLRIWEMHQSAPSQPDDMPVIDLAAGGDCVLVAARDGDVALQRLSAGEHALLAVLARSESLGEAVAAALQAEPGLQAAAVVARHLALGTLLDLREPA